MHSYVDELQQYDVQYIFWLIDWLIEHLYFVIADKAHDIMQKKYNASIDKSRAKRATIELGSDNWNKPRLFIRLLIIFLPGSRMLGLVHQTGVTQLTSDGNYVMLRSKYWPVDWLLVVHARDMCGVFHRNRFVRIWTRVQRYIQHDNLRECSPLELGPGEQIEASVFVLTMMFLLFDGPFCLELSIMNFIVISGDWLKKLYIFLYFWS